jgi:predicted transcriptional regulator
MSSGQRFLSNAATLIFRSTPEERVMTAKPKSRDEMSDEERAIWAKFDAEIQKGLDDIKLGRLIDADEVFDRLETKYAAMQRRG